jgi:hypothetical protein
LSLVSRLLGFAGCLIGAFTIGYYRGIHDAANGAYPQIQSFVQNTPDYATAVQSTIASYIQQNVTSTLNYYLAIGIVLAAGGFVLTAIGDRGSKVDGKKGAQQPPTASGQ